MDQTPARHRLMAILAADAAGYARLKADDEPAARAALDAGRAVLRSAVQRHGGRTVDAPGDAMLAVFETARGAIEAAAEAHGEIERAAFAELPAGRLRFRIGIHLGDVIEEHGGGRIHGHGVNVATRLQGLAAGGGVMVSDAVRATFGRRSGRVFVDEGVHAVLHIAEPVQVYRVRLGAIEELRRPLAPSRPEPTAARPAWQRRAWAGGMLVLALALLGSLWLAARPVPRAGAPGGPRLVPLSLALPPFDAPDDAASDADGVRRDLLVGIAATARNLTVLELADDAASAAGRREAALAAGLRYVLDGSVRREPGGLAVDLQLVDSSSGEPAWKEHTVLAALRGSAASVAERRELLARLVRAVTAAEMQRVRTLPTEHLSASELVLRAWSVFDDASLPALVEAERLLERALLLDPNHVHALTAKAALDDARQAIDPHADRDRLVGEMGELTARALTLDARDPYAWSARGLALVYLARWNEAVDAYDRALALDPDSASLRADRAWVEIVTGRPQAALPIVDAALALGGGSASAYLWRMRCQAELLLGHPAAAIEACERTTSLDPGRWMAHLLLAAADADAGELGKAADERRAVERIVPGYTLERLRQYRYSKHPDYVRLVDEHWFAGLRKAGLPER